MGILADSVTFSMLSVDLTTGSGHDAPVSTGVEVLGRDFVGSDLAIKGPCGTGIRLGERAAVAEMSSTTKPGAVLLNHLVVQLAPASNCMATKNAPTTGIDVLRATTLELS